MTQVEIIRSVEAMSYLAPKTLRKVAMRLMETAQTLTVSTTLSVCGDQNCGGPLRERANIPDQFPCVLYSEVLVGNR